MLDKLGRKFLCCVGDAFPRVFFDLGCNKIARRSGGFTSTWRRQRACERIV
jgi:hypothetical protein